MSSLLEISDALKMLLERFLMCSITSVRLENASGRVLGRDVHSEIDLPPFSNSSMDGFAVIADDTLQATPTTPTSLQVVVTIPAGVFPSQTLLPGQAARIMTGAVIPPGADAVIPLEDTQSTPAGSEQNNLVQIGRACKPGDYVRKQGQDLLSGQPVFTAGRKLNPQDIGMLAALGFARVAVFKRPLVAIVSSGDELVEPGQPLLPGQIRDTNTFTMQALVEKYGGRAVRIGTAPDRLEDVRSLLNQAAAIRPDLILTTAGVSVGDHDYVRDAIQLEGRLEFWRVNMRPGKPLAFGSYKGIPVIGLPGNPVSAFVGFHVFVKPALRKMSGTAAMQQSLAAMLEEPVFSDGRQSYLRGIVTKKSNGYSARLAGEQGSGNLFSLIQANALLIVPSGVKSLAVGSIVEAWLMVDETL